MKVTSLHYLDAKFHHPSLGASPPNRGNRISCVQNSCKTENRNSVNNSGIGILCSKNSNGRLAFPAVAGLLVSRPAVNFTLHCRTKATLLPKYSNIVFMNSVMSSKITIAYLLTALKKITELLLLWSPHQDNTKCIRLPVPDTASIFRAELYALLLAIDVKKGAYSSS